MGKSYIPLQRMEPPVVVRESNITNDYCGSPMYRRVCVPRRRGTNERTVSTEGVKSGPRGREGVETLANECTSGVVQKERGRRIIDDAGNDGPGGEEKKGRKKEGKGEERLGLNRTGPTRVQMKDGYEKGEQRGDSHHSTECNDVPAGGGRGTSTDAGECRRMQVQMGIATAPKHPVETRSSTPSPVICCHP